MMLNGVFLYPYIIVNGCGIDVVGAGVPES